MKQKQYCR